MDVRVVSYVEQVNRWPDSGRHILAQYDEGTILVYQAIVHPSAALPLNTNLAPLAAAALAFAASRATKHNKVTVVGYMTFRDPLFVSYGQYPPRDAPDDLMERTSEEMLRRPIGSLSPSSSSGADGNGLGAPDLCGCKVFPHKNCRYRPD